MNVEKFCRVTAWVLIAGAVAAIFYPIVAEDGNFQPLASGLSAGVLIALAAQLFGQAKNQRDAAEKRSQFYLDSCVKAFEEARELLGNENNDRATWIAAGRALRHAEQLAAGVTEDSHLRVLELHRLRYRRFFHEVLHNKTAAFFYGAQPSMQTDDAARWSSEPERGGTRNLSEKSLHAVWQASQWPTDYADPLDRVFTNAERDNLFVLFRGLHEYLEHKQLWHSASGRLFDRQGPR